MEKKNYLLYSIVIFGLFFFGSLIVASAADDESQPNTYLQSALQQEQTTDAPLSDLKLPNVFHVMLRFFLSLMLIVGLIWGSALLYSRFFATKYFAGRDADLIKVLAHHHLDTKKSVYLLEVAQKIFVVGAGTEQLELISEIDDMPTKQHIYSVLESKAAMYRSRDFKNILAGFAAPPDETATPPGAGGKESQGLGRLHEQIQKIKRMINEK